jgi:hypothetical protein
MGDNRWPKKILACLLKGRKRRVRPEIKSEREVKESGEVRRILAPEDAVN